MATPRPSATRPQRAAVYSAIRAKCGVTPACAKAASAVSVAGRIPWWTWSGGLFGALFIGLAILLVPKLGAATFFALLVTGQMLASVLFDQVGLLGLAQRPVDLPRLFGVALLIGGVVMIRR